MQTANTCLPDIRAGKNHKDTYKKIERRVVCYEKQQRTASTSHLIRNNEN